MDNDYPVYPYLGYIQKVVNQPIAFPPQHQDQAPGVEWAMNPRPIFHINSSIFSSIYLFNKIRH